jgi:hypothetical protein
MQADFSCGSRFLVSKYATIPPARLEGLLDEPRPGAPRQIGDADVERVLTLTLEATPRTN